jgi:hypothetical protein
MTTLLSTVNGIYQWREGASLKRLPGLDKDGVAGTTVSLDGMLRLESITHNVGKQMTIVDHGDLTIHSPATHMSVKVKVAKVCNVF